MCYVVKENFTMADIIAMLQLSVAELRTELEKLNLPTNGFKAELQSRLLQAKAKIKGPESGEPVPVRKVESAQCDYKRVAKLIPDYDGKTNVYVWKATVKQIMQTYNGEPEKMRLECVPKFKGAVKQWFEADPANIGLPFTTLMTRLEEVFAINTSAFELRKKLGDRLWREGEVFAEYVQQKIILSAQLNLSESELMQYIIEGVNNDGLRRQLCIARFQCVREMISAIGSEVQKKRNVMTATTTTAAGEYKQGSSSAKSSSSSTSSAATATTTTTRDTPIRKCYNCGEFGHMAGQCTKSKREPGACFRCGKTDHQIKDCTDGESKDCICFIETGSNKKMVHIILHFREGETSLETDSVLDSGSPVSLIKESALGKLSTKVNRNKNCCGYIGINESKVKVVGYLIAAVEFDGKRKDIEFKVVKDETLKANGLVGRDFIGAFNGRMVFDSLEINFKEDRDTMDDMVSILNIEYDSDKELRVDINADINLEVKKQVHELFKKYDDNYKLGKEPEVDYEMKINLTQYEPFSTVPRPLSYEEKDRLMPIIDELLSKKTIRHSDSEFCSPIVLVKKKNGERRLCCDYRRLNKIIAKDNFPMPIIDELLGYLNNKVFFTSLDLRDGFFHIRIKEECKKYTSFVTPFGQYEWNRMPQGLKVGPANFQRFITMIFGDLIKEKKLIIFMDDLLIATRSIEEHLEVLKAVLELSSKNLLNLRMDKCRIMYSKIRYLGYDVNQEGIRPNGEKAQAIKEFKVPTNVRAVQRFLGMCGFFRKFVKGFSEIAAPLRELTKDGVKFSMGKVELKAFEELKEKLANDPVLAIYDPNAKTELHCDASAAGFGAILMQEGVDGWHPVFYFSKRTSPEECKYHSFELECLAIVYALRRFRIYLHGKSFKILTDCNSLTLALNKRNINARIARWAQELQEFDYELEHREGKRMQHVDALSRVHELEKYEEVMIVEELSFEDNLAIIQGQDKELLKLRELLEKQPHKFYELRNGVIFKKINKGDVKFLVPSCMEQQVIRNCHESYGHGGVEKTVELIRRFYWFEGITEKVKLFIQNCLKCIVYNAPTGKKQGLLNSIEKSDKPFDTIHLDFYGPLENRNKYKYILAIIDGFTKFVRLLPTKSQTTKEVILACEEYFNNYSRPRRIITDRGTCFSSKEFKDYLDSKGVGLVLIAAGAPRANGQVERLNRTLNPMVAKLVDKPQKRYWVEVLPEVEFGINNTVCKSTGYTPCKLLFGVNQKDNVNSNIEELLDYGEDCEEDILVIRENAVNKIKQSQEYNKMYYDRNKKPGRKYEEGDLVMISNVDCTVGVNKKFIPKYKGPYKVKKCLGNDRYVIADIDGFRVTNKMYESVIDCNRIKPYVKID